MPSQPENFRTSHHDWHSSSYVADWIAKDVTRDDERRPLLRQMLVAAPFARAAAIDVLDVGAGYGIVTDEVLKFFPAARVVMQDYSRPMSVEARERLGKGAREPRYVLCDLTDPAWPKAVGGPFVPPGPRPPRLVTRTERPQAWTTNPHPRHPRGLPAPGRLAWSAPRPPASRTPNGAGYAGRAPARVLDPTRPVAGPAATVSGTGSRLSHAQTQQLTDRNSQAGPILHHHPIQVRRLS